MMKDNSLNFAKIETKSNNLKILGEDVIGSLHNMNASLEQLLQNLLSFKNSIIQKTVDHNSKVIDLAFNIQIGNKY